MMTLEQAAEILNRRGYLASMRGQARWYVVDYFPPGLSLTTGLGHILDEFTAIAIAEKYANDEARAKALAQVFVSDNAAPARDPDPAPSSIGDQEWAEHGNDPSYFTMTGM